ncbi:MAG TPA: hypothetical protein VF533_23600 [Solirubrobacteraceae bacterium]|jgi:hypothetical protein
MPFPIPSRKRGKLETATRAAKRVALARAAYALWQTRLARKLPGRKPKPFVTPLRAGIVGGVLAGLAGLIRSRRGGGGGGGGSAVPEPTPPPAPSNYDAPGPPANTATPLPATPPSTPAPELDLAPEPAAGIDEEAEVAAAAAEAAAIGGTVSDYAPSIVDEELDEAERPLAEAGEGVSEGQEQAEGDLVELATSDIGPGTGQSGAEALIEETIAQQSTPASGESADLPSAPPGDR